MGDCRRFYQGGTYLVPVEASLFQTSSAFSLAFSCTYDSGVNCDLSKFSSNVDGIIFTLSLRRSFSISFRRGDPEAKIILAVCKRFILSINILGWVGQTRLESRYTGRATNMRWPSNWNELAVHSRSAVNTVMNDNEGMMAWAKKVFAKTVIKHSWP